MKTRELRIRRVKTGEQTFEGLGVASVAVLEALEELGFGRDQLIDCRGADAGVHGGMPRACERRGETAGFGPR